MKRPFAKKVHLMKYVDTPLLSGVIRKKACRRRGRDVFRSIAPTKPERAIFESRRALAWKSDNRKTEVEYF